MDQSPQILLNPLDGACAEPCWLLPLPKTLTNTPEPTLRPCTEAGWLLPLFKHLGNKPSCVYNCIPARELWCVLPLLTRLEKKP